MRIQRKPFFISCLTIILIFSGMSAQAQRKRNKKATAPEKKVIIEDIRFYDNKKTKNFVLENEFLFKKGDTMSYSRFKRDLRQSKLNLTNTSLFNFVTVDTIISPLESGYKSALVQVRVLERWYVWPIPILETTDRNFNAWLKTKDYTRINYGVDLKWYNFTGRHDDLGLVACWGKNQRFGLSYKYPYINKSRHFGSSISVSYTRNKEIGVKTEEDKLEYIFSPHDLSTQKNISIGFIYRHTPFISQEFSLGYDNYIFSDTVVIANPEYTYKNGEKLNFLTLAYKLKLDYRDVRFYPLHGWYSDVEIIKKGLGFGFEKPVDIGTLKTSGRYYWQFGKKWYAATSLVLKFSTSAYQPYFFMKGLGYEQDYVRGYESYVIDGKDYGYSRSSIKYELFPKRVVDLKWLRLSKFSKIHFTTYLNGFLDMGYVNQPQWRESSTNKLPKTLLLGGGVGMDVVTYYDKIFRIEYAINKMGKTNFSFHFVTGI